MAADPERLARFQREAEVLAALNHPHIAQIFGLEGSADLTALVMELVEGEDLSQRIARGPIPLDEALPITRQIAEALDRRAVTRAAAGTDWTLLPGDFPHTSSRSSPDAWRRHPPTPSPPPHRADHGRCRGAMATPATRTARPVRDRPPSHAGRPVRRGVRRRGFPDLAVVLARRAVVAFVEGNQLKRIGVDGGPPAVIASMPLAPLGVSWTTPDTIVFAQSGGIMRVAASGHRILRFS